MTVHEHFHKMVMSDSTCSRRYHHDHTMSWHQSHMHTADKFLQDLVHVLGPIFQKIKAKSKTNRSLISLPLILDYFGTPLFLRMLTRSFKLQPKHIFLTFTSSTFDWFDFERWEINRRYSPTLRIETARAQNNLTTGLVTWFGTLWA